MERKTFANVRWTWLYRTTSCHPSCSRVTQKSILWAQPDTSVPLNMQFPLPGMLGIFFFYSLGQPLSTYQTHLRQMMPFVDSFSSLMFAWVISGLSGGIFQVSSMAVWLRSVSLLQVATSALCGRCVEEEVLRDIHNVSSTSV